MRVRTVSGQPQKTHVVVLDKGEEVTASLLAFAGSLPADPMPARAVYAGAKACVTASARGR